MNTMPYKKCTACLRTFPITSFYRNGNRRRSECGSCHSVFSILKRILMNKHITATERKSFANHKARRNTGTVLQMSAQYYFSESPGGLTINQKKTLLYIRLFQLVSFQQITLTQARELLNKAKTELTNVLRESFHIKVKPRRFKCPVT